MIHFHVYPKISCLLVTAKNRLDYLKKSFSCYVDQTYPNKELVIVNEGPKEYQDEIQELVSSRSDVKLIFLDGKYSLGSLRNISISLSNGDIFVQWDDDDFNIPERLSIQYKFLARNKRARACYLSDQLHYYFNTHSLYWENWAEYCSGNVKKFSLIPGTIMAWKDKLLARYPSGGKWCSAGEDSILAYKLCDVDNYVELLPNYGYMQVYSYHGNNVWDHNHHLEISNKRSMKISHMLENRERICRTLDYLKLNNVVDVMGREGLAFRYEAKN